MQPSSPSSTEVTPPPLNGQGGSWPPHPHHELRLRDFSLKVLIPVATLLATLSTLTTSALWAVYDRPTTVKVQRMIDRQGRQIQQGFQRIEKRMDRQSRRLERQGDRIRDLERKK